MLTSLRVKHFAIVKELELDFGSGMTAFTGETGAGKSIMIDALLLALGERADASVIRPGEEQCDITASFHIEIDSEPHQWLIAHDVPYDNEEIHLRRLIFTEGRSKSYINGQPFPLQKVKELSEQLVHIHGQHQHQTLMQHQTHRQQLDQYAQHQAQLDAVNNLYKQWQQTKQQLDKLEQQEQQDDRIQLLQFQLEELNNLNLQPGEAKALDEEHQMLHHAQTYIQTSQQINELLNGDNETNVCSFLSQLIHLIEQLPQEQAIIKNIGELLNQSLIQCEEAASEVQRFAERIPVDPDRLQAVEGRMATIHHLARKYHVDVASLAHHRTQLEQELKQQQKLGQQKDELYNRLTDIEEAYHTAALKLRLSRQHSAAQLAQEITNTIQQLGMPKGWIEVEITPLDRMQPHGQDKVEYKVCTNPGMTPDILPKIASGGELSRISLAIQLITAQRGATPTLLFDEVDVGIGGATAALVGRMLHKLGERLQVFCVTHQPQVASSAHHHFRVQKHSDEQHTFTDIVKLNFQDKIDEIARMLGGLTMTEQTRLHAQELLKQQVEYS